MFFFHGVPMDTPQWEVKDLAALWPASYYRLWRGSDSVAFSAN